jgi:hypothetical protein
MFSPLLDGARPLPRPLCDVLGDHRASEFPKPTAGLQKTHASMPVRQTLNDHYRHEKRVLATTLAQTALQTLTARKAGRKQRLHHFRQRQSR